MHNFMYPYWLQFVRTIDAGSEGGSKGGSDNPNTNPGNGGNGAGDDNATDWQAKYEAAIKHSREWESRAKANKSAADELKKLKESQLSDAEKYEQVQKELASIKAEKQQAEWKTQVAQETGVPAGLLRGSTLEELQAHGEALKAALADARKPTGGNMRNVGKTPDGVKADDMRAFARQLLGKQ